MNKKLMAMLFALALILLSGCAGQTAPAENTGDNSAVTAPGTAKTDTEQNAEESRSVEVGENESKENTVPEFSNNNEDDDEIIDWGDDEIVDPDDFQEVDWYETYEEGDWVYAKRDGGNWRAYSYKGSDETVTVPSEFRGGSVTEVGVWCFRDNTTVRKITIPDSVVLIDENCFMGCSNLESVEMPRFLNLLGNQAFSGCWSLKRCVVPEGVKELDYRQFDECESLQEVVLPSTLIEIGEAAFRHCYSLETINFRGSAADWEGIDIAANALNDSVYRVVTGYTGN